MRGPSHYENENGKAFDLPVCNQVYMVIMSARSISVTSMLFWREPFLSSSIQIHLIISCCFYYKNFIFLLFIVLICYRVASYYSLLLLCCGNKSRMRARKINYR